MNPGSQKPKTRLIAGTMTGTSIDGLDAALIEVTGHGLNIEISVRECLSRSLGTLTYNLRRLAEQQPMTAQEICQLNYRFSKFHSDCLSELIGGYKIDLIALHGQTIFHSPPLSWQLINPSLIAHSLNVPVVYDLRAADLFHGGQGAPITPLADFILFRDINENRSIINLGGFCNITTIPAILNTPDNKVDPEFWQTLVSGTDLCPCNHLLDNISRNLIGQQYDEDGINALSGNISERPFDDLMRIFKDMLKEGRSLGTGDETGEWISRYSGEVVAVDLARTACAAIAQMIVDYCDSDRIILAGGGFKNAALVEEIKFRFSGDVSYSDQFDISHNHREAIEMAILGALCQDRIPITLPQVTGSKSEFISGCWVLP